MCQGKRDPREGEVDMVIESRGPWMEEGSRSSGRQGNAGAGGEGPGKDRWRCEFPGTPGRKLR